MDPTQAAGLTLAPTSMIPRVFPALDPTSPEYNRLSAMPAGQMALLMGNAGKPQGIATSLGRLYEGAATEGDLPSTRRMTNNLAGSRGMDNLFKGEKAGKGDMESYTVPGYEYGNEPLMLGEAVPTFEGLLDASLYGETPAVQAKYGSEGMGGYYADKWASRALNRKVGKGPEVNEYVMRRLFR